MAGSPEVLAGLGVAFSGLRRHVLAVASVDQNGDIADYSNRCGRAAAFCLAAPGTDIVIPLGGADPDDYSIGSGTSYAAPVVSGALALLRQYFRNPDGSRALGNVELVRRLLTTADKTGRYADSAVYGQGLLDLDAATRPVGPLRTSLSSDPASRPLAGTGLDLAGGAFGSRLPEALAGAAAVGFDRLDAPFPVSLSGLGRGPAREEGPTETVARGAETPSGLAVRALYDHAPRDGSRPGELLLSFSSAGSRTPGDERDWWLSWGRHAGRSLGLYRDGAAGLFADRSAFAAPWLSLVRDGPGVGASLPLADGGRVSLALMRGSPHAEGFRGVGGDEGAGAVAEYRPDDGALSLQAGFVREEDGFLGARPRGALGEASAATAFAGFNRRQPLADGWDLLSSGWVGWTRPEVGDGAWLAGVSELRSSAFGLGLERRSVWREGDRFGLRLSQPLSVESGSATLRYAVGRTAYREALVETRRVTLAPAARPWQVEAAWRAPWAGGELSASLGAERSAWTNAGTRRRPLRRPAPRPRLLKSRGPSWRPGRGRTSDPNAVRPPRPGSDRRRARRPGWNGRWRNWASTRASRAARRRCPARATAASRSRPAAGASRCVSMARKPGASSTASWSAATPGWRGPPASDRRSFWRTATAASSSRPGSAGGASTRPRRPFDRRLLARLARCFRDLRAIEGFGGFMDPWRKIDGYLDDAGVSDPAGADAVGPLWPAAAALRERTSPRDVDAVPAHVDPAPENLIDDGRRVVMLDWEYSARTHPMWDPACFAVEADLGPEEARALLERAGADREADDFDAWRAAVCLVSLTWCLARRRRAGADAWRWEAEIARRRGTWERRASSLPGPRP